MNTPTIQFGFAFAFLGTATFALAGCGANYTVSGHAESAAFARPRCNIVVAPIRADRLVVDGKSEAEYVAHFKKAQAADSYDSDKVASEQTFREALMAKHGTVFTGRPNESTFVIRPTWNTWEPGYFAGMFSKPGIAQLAFDVVDANGRTVDQVAVEATSGQQYATGERMRKALKNAGNGLGAYIDQNWQCAR
ncbi:MAG TPA: hypothetical protein VH054_03785 [Polyangiaceae bacterium]|jgi:hypothetical protein|nr:hypothetical protein [Polyangiaceae bacterium]